MKRISAVVLGLLLSSATWAQIRLNQLTIKKGETYTIIGSDILVVDDLIGFDAMPGEDRGPRRHADRTGGVEVGEARALGRELVEIRRLEHGVARAAHGVPALLVGDDEEHVERRLRRIGCFC